MPETTKRGSYAKSARRQAEIMDAAFLVFSRIGFRSSTLSEIAKIAGITLPGLTHHFPTKEALLEAVIDQRDQQAGELLTGRRGMDFLRGLLQIVERDQGDPELTRLFAILSAESGEPQHPAHDYFSRRYGRIVGYVRRALVDIAAEGKLRDGLDPGDAADACLALFQGLQVQAPHATAGFSQARIMRSAMQAFLTEPL